MSMVPSPVGCKAFLKSLQGCGVGLGHVPSWSCPGDLVEKQLLCGFTSPTQGDYWVCWAGAILEGHLPDLAGWVRWFQQGMPGQSELCYQDGWTVSELALVSTRPARLEKAKDGTCQHSQSWRNFQQIPAPPAHTLKLANKSPSCIPLTLFKLLPLCRTLE